MAVSNQIPKHSGVRGSVDLSALHSIKAAYPMSLRTIILATSSGFHKTKQDTHSQAIRAPKPACLAISTPATRQTLDPFAHFVGRNEKTLF